MAWIAVLYQYGALGERSLRTGGTLASFRSSNSLSHFHRILLAKHAIVDATGIQRIARLIRIFLSKSVKKSSIFPWMGTSSHIYWAKELDCLSPPSLKSAARTGPSAGFR